MAKKTETYEALSTKLEGIVDKLSESELPLDEMIKLYEEGSLLAKRCRDMLEDYKARLETIEKQCSEDENE